MFGMMIKKAMNEEAVRRKARKDMGSSTSGGIYGGLTGGILGAGMGAGASGTPMGALVGLAAGGLGGGLLGSALGRGVDEEYADEVIDAINQGKTTRESQNLLRAYLDDRIGTSTWKGIAQGIPYGPLGMIIGGGASYANAAARKNRLPRHMASYMDLGGVKKED